MRGNWIGNTALQERVLRADPMSGLIVEAIAFPRGSYKQTFDGFNGADSTVGFQVLSDRVRLTPGSSTLIASTTGPDVYRTALDSGLNTVVNNGKTIFDCAKVSFAGTEQQEIELYNVQAYLNPVIDGIVANKQVQWWVCSIYAYYPTGGSNFQLFRITAPRAVVATTAAGMVTFDFSQRAPRPKPIQITSGLGGIIYIEIVPWTSAGALAGNAGWGFDSTVASVVSGGKTLSGSTLTPIPATDGNPEGWQETDLAKTPRVTLLLTTVANATLAFTGVPNRLDLGAVPTGNVEFCLEAAVPKGCTLTAQVRNDADAAWVTFVDGSITSDSTGDDSLKLVGVTKRQTYKIQLLLVIDGSGTLTPEVFRVGVAEVTPTNFDGQIVIDGGRQSIDPITFKGSVSQATIRFVKDGITDYRDAISDLLTTYTPAQILFRVWVGDSGLARSSWMLKDIYKIEDYSNPGPSIDVLVISVADELRQVLPVHVVGSPIAALGYDRQTINAVVDDLVDVQVALPARYRGALVESSLGNVTKQILQSDAKKELDALFYIAGGGGVTSQGRYQFKRLVADIATVDNGQAIVAVFPEGEVQFGPVTMGMKDRVVESFCRFGYSFAVDQTGSFAAGWYGDARRIDDVAATALGRARLGVDPHLGEEIEQWLPAEPITSLTQAANIATAATQVPHNLSIGQAVLVDGVQNSTSAEVNTQYNGTKTILSTPSAVQFTYAVTAGTPATATEAKAGSIRFTAIAPVLAQRVVNTRAQGLILIPFQSEYAQHHLEVGDWVAVQIDRIVGKSIKGSGRPIRAGAWAIGPIVDVRDQTGRNFVVWLQSNDNLLGPSGAARRLGFVLPVVQQVTLNGDEGGDGAVRGRVRCSDAGSVRWAVSTGTYPDLATTEAGTLVACNADGTADLGTVFSLAQNQTVYISVIAYEESDGSGASSTFLGQAALRRIPASTKTLRWTYAQVVADTNASSLGILIDTGAGYVHPSTSGGGTLALQVALPVPVGVTLTAFRASLKCTKVSGLSPDQTVIRFYRQPASGAGAATSLGDEFQLNAGWNTVTHILNELTIGRSYYAQVLLGPGTTGGVPAATDTGFEWVEIDYQTPSYYETL